MSAQHAALQVLSPSTPSHLVEAIGKFIAKLEAIDADKRYRKIESRHAAIEREAGAFVDHLRREMNIQLVRSDDGIVQDIRCESVGQIHGLRSYLSEARKAVKALQTTEKNSRLVEAGSVGNRSLERRHIALSSLAVSRVEQLKASERQTANITKKQRGDHHASIAIEAAISTARELLSEKSYVKVALGIALLSGRRTYEILSCGSLKAIGSDRAIFDGQAKTKSREVSSYEIPILGGLAVEVATALEKLRALKPEFVGMDSKSLNAKVSKEFGNQVKRAFAGSIEVAGGSLSPHTLRGAYGAICWEKYGKATGQEKNYYLSSILGHSESDKTVAYSYNYVSAA